MTGRQVAGPDRSGVGWTGGGGRRSTRWSPGGGACAGPPARPPHGPRGRPGSPGGRPCEARSPLSELMLWAGSQGAVPDFKGLVKVRPLAFLIEIQLILKHFPSLRF